MGRYYSGDIEGKFAFGSQSSDAADRFGVTGNTPGYLEYYYSVDDLVGVKSELKLIEESFGEHKMAIMAYHDLQGADNHTMLIEEFLNKTDLPEMNANKWNEYHDYAIGKKILECVNENGECQFDAEL